MHPTKEIIILFIIFFSILLLILSIFIILVVYKYQKKRNIYTLELTTLKNNYDNSLLRAQIEIQEQTFQNISRDIHDNVGQKLSLAKLYLNSRQNNPTEINNAASIITDAITDLRNLSRTLSSELIVSSGLIQALESEINLLEQTNLFEIRFEVEGEDIFLDENTDLILFRIIQEALQNVIKHSKANRINIKLNYQKNELAVGIHDNGVGYLENNLGGQGLKNMRARTKLLNGFFDILGNPETGTKIKIIIPINENQQP